MLQSTNPKRLIILISKHKASQHIMQGVTSPFILISNMISNGAFTLDVKLVLNENLGGILGGIQC